MMIDGEISRKKEPFSPINSTTALSPTPASMLLCRSVCLFVSLAGSREGDEIGGEKGEKEGEQSAVVLSSYLIKDHFSRHTLKGKCEQVCTCVRESRKLLKMQQKCEFYKVFQSNCSPKPY